MTPSQTMIGIVRRVEERVFASRPIEFPGVDDDSADPGAVAAQPFGEGMDDNISAKFEGFR